ncbi:MAG: nuclear transport factor 2 family protein [Ilumatobacteraceae bacterium]
MEIEQFIELEKQVWEALRRGDAAEDTRLLSEDFLGVYPSGFSDRSGHAAQLSNGPTVVDYGLSEARLLVVSDNDVMLAYRADWHGVGADDGPPESMYVSSLWSRRAGRWVNVFSQDCLVSDRPMA